MTKPLLLLIGYRAYGDWVYTAPVLPYLFEKYRVHLETTQKGYELFHNDPRFDAITVFPLENYAPKDQAPESFKRWKLVEQELKPDRVINLWRTLETECIAEDYQKEFYLTTQERREIFGNKSFLQAVFDRCEVPLPKHPKLDTLYYTEDEIAWGERWRKKHQSDFVVVIPVAGSCPHKYIPALKDLTYRITDKYHNAHVYLLGDSSLEGCLWGGDRIYQAIAPMAIKQTFLMTKYADMVMGPETGTMVAAGMWGTPKIMFCTASSVAQCTQFHQNDYSIQADIPCSPCHKSVYGHKDCESWTKVSEDEEGGLYLCSCTHKFDMNYAMSVVDRVYEEKNIYNSVYADRFRNRAKTEVGKRIIAERWSLIERYCHGNMTLLDYGCASGAFHRANRNGFITSGYDINPHYGYHAIPDSGVDILTMWDVIEHLHNPAELIQKFKAKYLFLCTPNVDAAGELAEWKHYRPGEHLHYFNLKSLTELLNQNGYRVLEHNFTEGAIRDPEKPENIITIAGVRE